MSEGTARKRVKQPAKTPEERQLERRNRFLTYAVKRVENALTRLQQVERLANRANYSYTPDEAAKISETLMYAVVNVRDAFTSQKAGKPQFQL